MRMDHFKKLVNQSKKIGAELISVFGYGEPLLDKSLSSKIKYCTKKGLKTFITTNAALLTPSVAGKLFDAGLTHMRLSAHGLWDSYEKVHKPLKFESFLRNVANALKMNEMVYKHGTNIDVTVIPMHNESIDEILGFWKRFKIDDLEIWRPHNWAGGRKYRKVIKRKKTCGRPFNGPIQINADGKMMVCCFDTDATMTVGDTFKDSIEDILQGDEFKKIRKAHKAGDMSGLICEQCDQLNEYEKSPLLYSTIDPACECGITSSMKVRLQ